MPFYPSLPMQRDYVDPLSAGVLGLGAGLEVGNRALKSQMYGEALAQEREKRQALKEYSQTGDVSKLMTVAPEIGVKMQEAQAYQQKVQLEAIKPGLDLAYMLSDGMTPENFMERRGAVTKIFPAMDALLPKTYDEKQMQSLRQSYEKRFKLEQPANWVYNQATGQWEQAPGPGKVSIARPYETPEEKLGRAVTLATVKEDLRKDRPTKSKDYTGKLADYDIKERQAASKIKQKYNKLISELTGTDPQIATKKAALTSAMNAELAENKASFDAARQKLGATVPRKALKDMSIEELRNAIARMKGQPAPAAAAPIAAPEEEDDEED